MPTEVDRLENESTDESIQAAISDCIATEVRGGMPQDQAVAACHEMARKKTGGRPAPKGGK